MGKLKAPTFFLVPKAVWMISIANMFVAISTTMALSIYPFFATNVLGLSVFSTGAMEGFTEGLSQISRLFSGVLSDISKKKKPILLFGIFLAVLSKPFFIFAKGGIFIMISKTLERVSNGFIATPRDSYIASISKKENLGVSYGLMMTGKTLGCIIGPVFISILMLTTNNFRMLLWFGLIPCVLSFVIVIFFVKENVSTSKDSDCKKKAPAISLKNIKKLPASYWRLMFVASVFMMSRFGECMLALRLQELGAPNYICVSNIAIVNLISSLCCLPIGKLSDRMDRSMLLFFSFVILILCHICFAFATEMKIALLGVLLWGAQRGTSQILFSAIIAEEAPKNMTGTAIGLFYIITGITSIVSGLIGSYIANISLKYSFIFGIIFSSLALLALLIKNISESRIKKIFH